VAALRGGGAPELSSLARFFVYVSTLRTPQSVADVVVRAVTRILSLDACQLSLQVEGMPAVDASWRSPGGPALMAPGPVASLRKLSARPAARSS
jgi:hypothetical protein